MKYYQLKARLLSPLLIQENRQSNAPRGLPYLPGSSLRGAIAGHYLRNGGSPEDESFKKIFLDDPVFFPDLLPVNQQDQMASPIPLTACSCKRSSGFKTQDGHGVGDSLAAILAEKIVNGALTEMFVCKTCQQDMKPYQGFWNDNPACPEKSEPVMIYQRHTGIDRITGTVASSIFYVTQGLSENRKGKDDQYHAQYLSGGIYLTDDQVKILSQWISEPIFAGADRTRGMGEMRLELKEHSAPAFDLEKWDQDFRKKVEKLISTKIPEGVYFSIELISHTILLDTFLRPLYEIELDFADVTPEARFIRQQTVRGWQSSWRLPKPEDMAVAMGSVYLFRYSGNDKQGLKTYLNQLMIKGIGLRRSEGFGRIRICDPFHVLEVI